MFAFLKKVFATKTNTAKTTETNYTSDIVIRPRKEIDMTNAQGYWVTIDTDCPEQRYYTFACVALHVNHAFGKAVCADLCPFKYWREVTFHNMITHEVVSIPVNVPMH